MNRNTAAEVFYKIFFALLGLSAIITEILVISTRGIFNPANFFSYFTIQTNLLVIVMFFLSAIYTCRNIHSRWLDIFRSLTLVYILVVGIGFAVLLSGLEGVVLTAVPWDNIVLHYIIPVAVLIDFLIDRPKSNIKFKTGLFWIFYPVVYVIYSLVRGTMTGWYPYPFLNPNLGGGATVFATVLGLVALGVILIFNVTRLTRTRSNR